MEFRKSVQKWDFCCSQRTVVSWIFWLTLCHLFTSSNGTIAEQERRALFQLRDSLNHPNGSALVNEWVGDDYCAWGGILCVSYLDGGLRVLDIFLTSKRQLGLGVWYPNASLFSHFKGLESLDLSGNYFGSWVMPEGALSSYVVSFLLSSIIFRSCKFLQGYLFFFYLDNMNSAGKNVFHSFGTCSTMQVG